jgi:hypothetical protein
MQVAAMEPEVVLLCGFPHVAQLAFIGAWILGGARAQPPATAYLVGHFLGNQLRRPAIHRAVAGGVDDQVGGQAAAVVQNYGIRFNAFDSKPRRTYFMNRPESSSPKSSMKPAFSKP